MADISSKVKMVSSSDLKHQQSLANHHQPTCQSNIIIPNWTSSCSTSSYGWLTSAAMDLMQQSGTVAKSISVYQLTANSNGTSLYTGGLICQPSTTLGTPDISFTNWPQLRKIWTAPIVVCIQMLIPPNCSLPFEFLIFHKYMVIVEDIKVNWQTVKVTNVFLTIQTNTVKTSQPTEIQGKLGCALILLFNYSRKSC